MCAHAVHQFYDRRRRCREWNAKDFKFDAGERGLKCLSSSRGRRIFGKWPRLSREFASIGPRRSCEVPMLPDTVDVHFLQTLHKFYPQVYVNCTFLSIVWINYLWMNFNKNMIYFVMNYQKYVKLVQWNIVEFPWIFRENCLKFTKIGDCWRLLTRNFFS